MTSSSGRTGGGEPARLLVVAGSGRSGTSTISGTLRLLGMHIPQPEVAGDESNPRGHFEPRWVVDFQGRLLRETRVKLADARPEAFELTRGIGLRPVVQQRLREWVAGQVAIAPEIVVKDPRNSWFLPMWREAGRALSVRTGYVTMLRHPAEVLASKHSYYHSDESGEQRRIGDTTRLAGWVNVALFTEHLTRDESRFFVRYPDLLSDWRGCVRALSTALDLSLTAGPDDDLARGVDEFIDPDLHRVTATWDDLDVPAAVRELAEDVWHHVNRLADTSGHDPASEAALDAARDRYTRMYADAVALAGSTVLAAARDATAKANAKAAKKAATDAPETRRSLSRRLVARGQRAGARLRRARGTATR